MYYLWTRFYSYISTYMYIVYLYDNNIIHEVVVVALECIQCIIPILRV